MLFELSGIFHEGRHLCSFIFFACEMSPFNFTLANTGGFLLVLRFPSLSLSITSEPLRTD
jgi:hypothetical protein